MLISRGGVAVVKWDNKQEIGPIGTFIQFPELKSTREKIIAKQPFIPFATIVNKAEEYSLTEQLHIDFPQAESRLSKGHKYDFRSNMFSTLDQIAFFDTAITDDYIAIIGLGKSPNGGRLIRMTRWIDKKYVLSAENFEKYKVFLPAANGSGAIGEVLSTPLVGTPLVGHTPTFLSIGSFDTEKEAEACLKYVKTKFARALLGILKITQHNPAKVWANVPLQDFTAASDIDWSKSIPKIDAQLYKKYGLSQEEIDFIEEKVKAME